MTGWRLGYIAGPKHFVSACNKLQSQVISFVPNKFIDLNECGFFYFGTLINKLTGLETEFHHWI